MTKLLDKRKKRKILLPCNSDNPGMSQVYYLNKNIMKNKVAHGEQASKISIGRTNMCNHCCVALSFKCTSRLMFSLNF